MARRPKNLRQQLADLVENFAPEIALAFQTAIDDITNRVILADVIRAIQAGDLEQALRSLGLSDAALRPVTAAIERAFETGGVTVAASYPKRLQSISGPTVFRFDVRNSRAEKWLRDQSSSLVTRIQDDVRTNVQNIIFRGTQDGRNPRNVALDLVGRINRTTGRREGGIIGLTQQQEFFTARAKLELDQMHIKGAGDNYFTRKRRDKRFDRIIKRAQETGTPIDAETKNRILGRYKDSLLKLRGDTIGRTEAIQALNRSEYESNMQLIDSGAIRKQAVKRYWDSSGEDGRTRESHILMDGLPPVGIDEPFTFPDGSKAMFPGDFSLGAPAEETINCRCRVRTEIDWLDGVE